jgi:cell division protein FtsB
VLLGLSAYYALFGGEYSLLELHKARRDIKIQQEELDSLRGKIDSLSAWVDSLQNDPATLERLAREKFGMVRDGEVLYWPTERTDSTGDTIR